MKKSIKSLLVVFICLFTNLLYSQNRDLSVMNHGYLGFNVNDVAKTYSGKFVMPSVLMFEQKIAIFNDYNAKTLIPIRVTCFTKTAEFYVVGTKVDFSVENVDLVDYYFDKFKATCGRCYTKTISINNIQTLAHVFEFIESGKTKQVTFAFSPLLLGDTDAVEPAGFMFYFNYKN